MNENIKSEFDELFAEIKRPGIEKLKEYLEKSDFFTAPASTRFHGDHEGGLLEHSVSVAKILLSKAEHDPLWKEKLADVSRESLTFCGLMHDICKTYYYTVELRNKKIDGEWQQVPCYTVDDKVPYGHGEKSVMMLYELGVSMSAAERYAVRWHMGPYSGQQDWGTLGLAMEKYPLCLALFEADMEATHICGK